MAREPLRYCRKGHDKDEVGREQGNYCRICFLNSYIPYLRNASEMVGDYYEIEMLDFPDLAMVPTSLPIGGHTIWGRGWPENEASLILEHEVYNDARQLAYEAYKDRQHERERKRWRNGRHK